MKLAAYEFFVHSLGFRTLLVASIECYAEENKETLYVPTYRILNLGMNVQGICSSPTSVQCNEKESFFLISIMT